MEYFEYSADILPRISLSGKHIKEAPWKNLRRTLKDYVFYLVTDGEVFLMEDGVSYHLVKGDCVLLEPGKLQYGTKFSVCKFYYIHFNHADIMKVTLEEGKLSEWIQNSRMVWNASEGYAPFPEDKIIICKRFKIEDDDALINICHILDRLIVKKKVRLEHSDTLSACELVSTFVELQRQFSINLFKAVAYRDEKAERVNAVLLYLNSNYYRKLSSAIIEKELSYNFDYLNQLFKEYQYISIFKMLERIRIEEAKRLLRESALSVMAVASEVGYADERYFSKVFKRVTGYTPMVYRKMNT